MNVPPLPTNPAKLAEMISARKIEGGPAGPTEDFVQVGDLLRETLAPPALRSALFQVAAQIPGVKVLGTVTDTAGQSGVGVAYIARPRPGEIQQNELIFNRLTGALLAEQTVAVTRTGARTLTNWTDYLSSGVVNSISSTPPSGSALTRQSLRMRPQYSPQFNAGADVFAACARPELGSRSCRLLAFLAEVASIEVIGGILAECDRASGGTDSLTIPLCADMGRPE